MKGRPNRPIPLNSELTSRDVVDQSKALSQSIRTINSAQLVQKKTYRLMCYIYNGFIEPIYTLICPEFPDFSKICISL